MADEVTTGELYRLLESHGDDLKEIRKQTTLTNGRVIKVETTLEVHARELKDIKTQRPSGSGAHQQRRSSDRADAITLAIPMNKATVAVIVSAVAGILLSAGVAVAKSMGWMP